MQKIVLFCTVFSALAFCGDCLKENSGRQQGAALKDDGVTAVAWEGAQQARQCRAAFAR